MQESKIQWTDDTWNPLTGCEKISPGCHNCYAERTAEWLQRLGSANYANGFTLTLHPGKLFEPLRKKRPRKIFVNSMSDLFHRDVPDEFIRRVFGLISLAGQHTFQILTKRAGRMRNFFHDPDNSLANCQAEFALSEGFPRTPTGKSLVRDATAINGARIDGKGTNQWPLPNVWLGVSVENQEMANLRIPELMQTPAALRWVSAEPLLGKLDLEPWIQYQSFNENYKMSFAMDDVLGIDWLVIGGESGPNARCMNPEWVRSLIEQCSESYCKSFFKQWGRFKPVGASDVTDLGSKIIEHEFSSKTKIRFVDMGERFSEPSAILDGGEWREMPAEEMCRHRSGTKRKGTNEI